jgi:teichoic acid transport system permease protein
VETRGPSAAHERPQTTETRTASDGTARADERAGLAANRFVTEVHVYEPHRVGLPPMRPYLRELWRRREFAFELARTNLRAQHFTTVLGQLWLILNPLILALVYFVLVEIVRGGNRGTDFLAHLMLGLFAFRLVSMSVKQGARSVVGGGRLILNIAFPRSLLPLASVMTAFMRFIPTMIVYAVVHVIAGLPLGPQLLWALPIVALLLVLAAGAAMITAAVQVYFRDLRNILTYFLRIWLYASPVLYYADEVPDRFRWILAANPMYPLLGPLSDAVNLGENPSIGLLAWGAAWSVGMFIVGALFFISREREFAVRL